MNSTSSPVCRCCRACARRQSEALLAIIQAGERVEEVIAERRADVDATNLQVRQAQLSACYCLLL